MLPRSRPDPPTAAFVLLLLAFALTFGWMAWAGNRAFMPILVDTDLGMWHVLMKHAVQGELPLFRNPYSGTLTHYFAADHFNPLIFLVIPLWVLMPSNTLFAWVQIAAHAGAAALLFAIARLRLQSTRWACLIGGAFLLSPLPTLSLYNHFSSSPFLILFLPWAVWCLLRERTLWYWVALGGLLLSREDAALLAATVGVYAALERRRVWLGIATIAIAGAYLFLVLWVLMPYWAGGFPYPYITRGYGWLGPTPSAALLRLVTEPRWVVERLSEMGALHGLLLQLLPFAFTPLVSWRGLIFLVPVGQLVLHAHTSASTLTYHHAYRAAILAGLAAVEGVRQLRISIFPRLPARVGPVVVGGLLASLTVATHLWAAYSPISREFDWAEFQAGPRERAMRQAMEMVPPGSRVSASRVYMTHLVPSREFECVWEHVEIRDGSDPAGLWCDDTEAPLSADYVLLTDEPPEAAEVRRLRDSGVYAPVFERLGTVLFRRAGGPEGSRAGRGGTLAR